MNEPMLKELQREARTTKRLLERVPEDKLSWKPHPKSMSLGQLALHLAQVPGGVSRIAQRDEFDISKVNPEPRMPESIEEILTVFDKSISDAADYLSNLEPAAVDGTWRLLFGAKVVFSASRAEMLRSMLLNHCYHHRGQLSVYLRLLDVPIPSIYGRSADELPATSE
jgi:uncharacterized damage-inducible protein DinB